MSDSHQQLFLILAGKKYPVTHFHCPDDAISTNYRCQVSFTSTDALQGFPGDRLCLAINNKRYLHGRLATWIDYGKMRGLYSYELVFFSDLSVLDPCNNKNYVHQPINNILLLLLQQNKLESYQMSLKESPPPTPLVAQYQQSDLSLFEYLLHKHKGFYIWEQLQEKAVLKILDDKTAITASFKAHLLADKPFNTGIDNEEVVFKKSLSRSSNGNVYYFFETNCCALYPGQILHLSTHDIRYNKSFRIIKIEHFGEQYSDSLHAQQACLLYKNTLTCTLSSADFLKKPRKQPFLQTLTANTAAVNDQTLDQKGSYYVNFSYDPHTATPALKRTQDFNGNQIAGMHFPLRKGARVLMGFINDNINTPVLLGQIPTPKQPSPVTNQNPYQYIIRTPQESQWILDDRAQSISLENTNNSVLFHQRGIAFKSHQGNLYIENAKNYALNTGLNHTIQTKAHYQQTLGKASVLLTKKGGITLEASQTLRMQATQNIQIQSQQIQITAKNTVEFLMRNQLCNIKESVEILALELLTCLAGTTHLQASKQCQINEAITLQQNSLKIKAQSLSIRAETIEVYQDTRINN